MTHPYPESLRQLQSAAAEWYSAWSWQEWLLLLTGLVTVLLVFYAAIRMLIHRIRLRRMVGTMREDLLLRRELAAMAAGKDPSSQQREQYLRTESIRMDMAAARRTMAENGIRPRRTGNWLLLGEPGSGKSRLMAAGGLTYPAGMNDFSRAAEATSTLNLWLTEKGTVWDIGGRMFLSRWGGRQDNEWQLFLHEYRRLYRGTLPSGVILTIPADALLLDSPELRDRKIALIAEEMRALSHATGASCPVWVVVTKCDEVEGFSEFCALLSEQDCEQALGWANPAPDTPIDPAAAATAFDDIVERLKALRAAYALNEQVWEQTAQSNRRGDIVTPVYLMPERFAAMKENLRRYLAGIFTHIRHHQGRHGLFRLQGFWFTAVLDKPVISQERVVFEKGDQGLRPVAMPQADTAPQADSFSDPTTLTTVRESIISTASDRHYFSKNLLARLIIGSRETGVHTDAATRRIRRPYRLAALLLVLLALPLSLWAFFRQDSLAELTRRDQAFWEEARQLFHGANIEQAPLLTAEKELQLPLLDQNVPGTGTSRSEYVYAMSNMSGRVAHLPLFWQPAAWLVDHEFSTTLLGRDKKFIDKATLTCMLLRPAVESSRAVICYQADHPQTPAPRWEQADTATLLSLMTITRNGIRLLQGEHVVDDVNYAFLINVRQAPLQNRALHSIWTHSSIHNESIRAMSMLNALLQPVSTGSVLALNKGVELYTTAARNLNIYSDLHYAEMQELVQQLERMTTLRRDMLATESRLTQAVAAGNYSETRAAIEEWKRLYAGATTVAEKLRSAELQLNLGSKPSLRTSAAAVQNALATALHKDEQAFASLSRKLSNSSAADNLRRLSAGVRTAVEEANQRMAADHARITDEICSFWDISESTPDGPRPWQSFYTEATRLHALFSFGIPAGTARETFHSRLLRVGETRELYDEQVARLPENLAGRLPADCWEFNWQLLEEGVMLRWLAEAPRTSADVVPESRRAATARKLPALPYTTADRCSTNPAFDPTTANACVSDLDELLRYVDTQCRKRPAGANAELEPALNQLRDSLYQYLTDYVMYWTEMIPAQYKIRNIHTWAQFVESADVLYSCDVGSALYEFNRLQLDAISIPYLMNEKLFPGVAAKRSALAQAQKALNSEYRRKFMTAANYLSKRNPDPGAAWQELAQMPPQDLMETWWSSWYPDSADASFVWWNEYLLHGMRLLKAEAAERLRGNVRDCMAYASRFPLCNTSSRNPGDFLDRYALDYLDERLVSIDNLSDDKREAEIAKLAAAQHIPLKEASLALPVFNQHEQGWEGIARVIALLANAEMPLTCELLLPASAMRAASLSGEDEERRIIPAGRRFPYCRISCGGRAITPLLNINRQSEEDSVLSRAPIPADAADLRIEFFRHSNAKSPDTTLRFDGEWSPINLYLSHNTRLSDDKTTAYIPLVFTDREGYTCRLWLGMRFNHEMISPTDWPGSQSFHQAGSNPEEEIALAEKNVRKAIRSTFLTPRNRSANPTAEQRKALLQSLDHLMQGRYSLSFKVIVPTAEECDDPQRLQTAAAYPYFALGTPEQSTGKLRSLPDARQTADIVLRPAQRILLRLYRHAGDEHSALFFEKQQATRDFVINHASAYSATNGYFTIPLPATDGTRTETFHIFLRPVLEVLTDDGLLPAAAPVHQTEYPQEDLPIN